MKLLWLGKYASEDIFIKMAKKGYRDPAAHQSQKNIIKALDELEVDVDSINYYNVPNIYEDFKIPSEVWTRTGTSIDKSIGYMKIPYFSYIEISIKLVKEVRKWIKKNSDQEMIILIYGMQSLLIRAALSGLKIDKKLKLFLIVPDLPHYMDLSMSKLKKALKLIDWQVIKNQIKKIYGFILYTEHMASFLGLKENAWMLMEGSIDVSEQKHSVTDKKKIIVMYSGKLDLRYGVVELLEAINLISDNNYEFWFSGDGNAVPLLKRKLIHDSRIKYFGYIPSREQLLTLQSASTMLVNTRLPSEIGSAYCFPSKLFEFMASGKPVLSFVIPGIPMEYFDYIIPIKNSDIAEIARTIEHVGHMTEEERFLIGEKAREFIVKYKNSKVQAKRIFDFITNNECLSEIY